MVEIEPYEFKKKTNIEEHNDIVDKVNEIVGVINDAQMDTIDTRLTAVEGDVTALESEVSSLDNELATKADKTKIPDVSNFITADALTPYAKTVDVDNADVTGVDATINNGEITIKLTRPDGDMSDSIDCPFIQTATLIPTSTARAFKIRFTYTDGTQYDTNEFVIPEGGGTDVSVTGVTVGDGTAPNSFKVTIQLSDASTINSNDYVIEFPENTDTYPTTLTGTLSGTTLNMTIGLNDGSSVQGTANLSALLAGYATTSYVDGQVATKLDKTTADGYYQPKGNYLTTVPIGGTAIGGVKNGGNVTIETDGTMNFTGGDGWEELNLSSLPADFAENDIIFGYTGIQPNIKASSWTGAITISDYTQVEEYRPFIFMLTDSKQFVRTNIAEFYNPVTIPAISSLSLYYVNTPSVWNEGGSSTDGLFQFAINAFNGSGSSAIYAPTIYKDNITQFVHKIWRLKSK